MGDLRALTAEKYTKPKDLKKSPYFVWDHSRATNRNRSFRWAIDEINSELELTLIFAVSYSAVKNEVLKKSEAALWVTVV